MLPLYKIFCILAIQRLNKMIAGNNSFGLITGQSGHVMVIKSHEGNKSDLETTVS
jgi:hypothetical protein